MSRKRSFDRSMDNVMDSKHSKLTVDDIADDLYGNIYSHLISDLKYEYNWKSSTFRENVARAFYKCANGGYQLASAYYKEKEKHQNTGDKLNDSHRRIKEYEREKDKNEWMIKDADAKFEFERHRADEAEKTIKKRVQEKIQNELLVKEADAKTEVERRRADEAEKAFKKLEQRLGNFKVNNQNLHDKLQIATQRIQILEVDLNAAQSSNTSFTDAKMELQNSLIMEKIDNLSSQLLDCQNTTQENVFKAVDDIRKVVVTFNEVSPSQTSPLWLVPEEVCHSIHQIHGKSKEKFLENYLVELFTQPEMILPEKCLPEEKVQEIKLVLACFFKSFKDDTADIEKIIKGVLKKKRDDGRLKIYQRCGKIRTCGLTDGNDLFFYALKEDDRFLPFYDSNCTEVIQHSINKNTVYAIPQVFKNCSYILIIEDTKLTGQRIQKLEVASGYLQNIFIKGRRS